MDKVKKKKKQREVLWKTEKSLQAQAKRKKPMMTLCQIMLHLTIWGYMVSLPPTGETKQQIKMRLMRRKIAPWMTLSTLKKKKTNNILKKKEIILNKGERPHTRKMPKRRMKLPLALSSRFWCKAVERPLFKDLKGNERELTDLVFTHG